MTLQENYLGVDYQVAEETRDDLALMGIDPISEIRHGIRASSTATLYSKPNCPYCVRAKSLLESRGIAIVEMSAVDNRDQLIESVTRITGTPPRTVPQIWLNDQYIGGFTELDEHLRAA